MARQTKVLRKDNIDRRELGYYYTPQFVADYISKRLLTLHPNGKKVLDPSVGQEELLDNFFDAGKEVDGIDVYQHKNNYQSNFIQQDFIEYYSKIKQNRENEQINLFDDAFENNDITFHNGLPYDYYIANPPYNCHEVNYIRDNKASLKTLFSNVGVHNMYSMFISSIIDLAKNGSYIGLITHDSFLTAKHHTKLREQLLNECSIHEITLCPNDLFHEQAADVRTSILILQKGTEYQGDVFVSNRPSSTQAFEQQLEQQLTNFTTGNYKAYQLNDITLTSSKDNSELIIECPDDVKVLFANERLGEAYRCVTGISTGNDKLYLSEKKEEPFTVPFYKNPGKNRFFTDNYIYLHNDFLTFDAEIKNFMVRNKSLLFQPGITCSSMGVQFTACRLPEQATYGVNANIICDDADVWWLLAYLNSELVTYIVRGILIRSNMITSGYVSRIPLLNLTEKDKMTLSHLSKRAYHKAKDGHSYEHVQHEINQVVNELAEISDQTIEMIRHFNLDLIKNT